MNLPLRDTPVILAFLIFRVNDDAESGAISFARRTSLATIVRPTTARRNVRTTCSTSGSSGIHTNLIQPLPKVKSARREFAILLDVKTYWLRTRAEPKE